jgi:hypothetical protein
MKEPKIPDRSGEPALQEALDREKSTTAANSEDVDPDAPPETRDDEGNVIDVAQKGDGLPAKPRPDADAGSQ